MKYYSISEAIIFLAQEYGEENMPTSEETLRRAIRIKKLLVQETGDPGRKGYTITEKNLRNYAEDRLKRIHSRGIHKKDGKAMNAGSERTPQRFQDLYGQYIGGRIAASVYYQELFNEKTKWEQLMYEKEEQLAKLDAQRRTLQNDIQSCQSAVDAYNDGIAKYDPQDNLNKKGNEKR